jgi:GNAT superfamily N-acetyltransferase
VTRRVSVTRTYLELTSPSQLVAGGGGDEDPLLRLARVPVMSVPLAQRLYREVGSDYHWTDRWKWSVEDWRRWVSQPGYGTWVLSRDGEVAGFFELTTGEDGSVEIALFGLVKGFHGRGLGKYLLRRAVEVAWAIGATRVWLHTCTLDHPAALPNYLARGFVPYKTETYEAELDDA